MGGTLITHPLDTVKVQMQTQKAKQFGFLSTFNIELHNILKTTIVKLLFRYDYEHGTNQWHFISI